MVFVSYAMVFVSNAMVFVFFLFSRTHTKNVGRLSCVCVCVFRVCAKNKKTENRFKIRLQTNKTEKGFKVGGIFRLLWVHPALCSQKKRKKREQEVKRGASVTFFSAFNLIIILY